MMGIKRQSFVGEICSLAHAKYDEIALSVIILTWYYSKTNQRNMVCILYPGTVCMCLIFLKIVSGRKGLEPVIRSKSTPKGKELSQGL